MPSIGTASVLEITWFVLALAGFCFAAMNAINRSQDLVWLRGSGLNGIRLFSARAHLREEVFAMVQLGLTLTVGAVAMFVPAAQSVQGRIAAVVPGVCVIGIELLIVAGSVMRFFERRRLIGDLDDKHRNDTQACRCDELQ